MFTKISYLHNLEFTLYIFSEDLFNNEECIPKGSKCDLVQIFHISNSHLSERHYSSSPFSLRDDLRHTGQHPSLKGEDVNFSPSVNQLNLKKSIPQSHRKG